VKIVDNNEAYYHDCGHTVYMGRLVPGRQANIVTSPITIHYEKMRVKALLQLLHYCHETKNMQAAN
jgi:hypothetical protein